MSDKIYTLPLTGKEVEDKLLQIIILEEEEWDNLSDEDKLPDKIYMVLEGT